MNCPKLRLTRLIRNKTDKLMWFKTNPEGPTNGWNNSIRSNRQQTREPIDFRKTVAVLKVPRTHDGALAREMRKTEVKLRSVCNTKVKIMEKVGPTLKSILVKSNPWSSENCPRPNCLPCKTQNKGFNCKRRNINF